MGNICMKEKFRIKNRQYCVKEVLGEGGFSIVYLCEESQTSRLYAVKKILCHSLEDEKLAENEIKIYNQVKHEYVMKLIDHDKSSESTGGARSCFYLVFPYFSRGTLLQELDRRGRSLRHFRPVEVYELFLKICEAVRAFHEFQPPIAHRDLKTANIMLDNSQCPIIMDLGSAAEARVSVETGRQARAVQDIAEERCSMPYRAPELFSVEPGTVIDERTDIWSLGCVLYAICFFKSPYDAVYERGDSCALAILSGNIHFSENQLYGQEMENLIKFMLQVNPEERPYIDSVIDRTRTELEKCRGLVDSTDQDSFEVI